MGRILQREVVERAMKSSSWTKERKYLNALGKTRGRENWERKTEVILQNTLNAKLRNFSWLCKQKPIPEIFSKGEALSEF